ncbi:DUF308 domain-containing protein [Candidatus Saccharibacteria bacterium]|nr:DUF308 domain-containing protein [Candidatus Saccharibacteria bacterium]
MVGKKRTGKKPMNIEVFRVAGYTGAHWGGFMLRALIAIALGLYCLFAPETILSVLTGVLSIGLIVLGVFELTRAFMLYREGKAFGLALISGGIEVILGAWLLANKSARFELLAVFIAIIAVMRWIFDLVVATKGTANATDRFMWFVTGVLGIAIGILIFFVPTFGWATSVAIIWIFGIYLLIMGLSNAFFAIHLSEKDRKTRRKK